MINTKNLLLKPAIDPCVWKKNTIIYFKVLNINFLSKYCLLLEYLFIFPPFRMKNSSWSSGGDFSLTKWSNSNGMTAFTATDLTRVPW